MNYTAMVLTALLFVLVGTGCGSLGSSADSAALSPDQRLAGEIQQRMREDPVTSSTPLSVESRGGIITLRGAADPHVRARALGIARSTPGVAEVLDQIRQ